MVSLGGSVFVRNAVEFDYCVQESVSSLCELCDDVVVLDCQSTDGTLDLLKQTAAKYGNLRVVEGGNWECAPNYDRLAILANQARSYLKTDWHFMLQADEVIHELSFNAIRRAISMPGFKSFGCRRYNLWGDTNHYLSFQLPQSDKPVSDTVIRLATTDNPACGDAESLQVDPNHISWSLTDDIKIVHYGFVRSDKKMIHKTISMQSWFFGPGGQPDARVVAMQESGRFAWEVMKTREMLVPIPFAHPRFSKVWAMTRQAEKTPV